MTENLLKRDKTVSYSLKSRIVNGTYNHTLLDEGGNVICSGGIDHVRGFRNLPDSTVYAYLELNEAELSRRKDAISGLEIKFEVTQKSTQI